MIQQSLWGEEFNIEDSPTKTKKLLNKVNNPKQVDVKKLVKSKKLSLQDRLLLIKENVIKVLGHHTADTLVIKTKDELVKYIDKTIENGIIAIDTETNNSLEPLTCKLMGPCIYTPGVNQAYIPLNHVNPDTGVRLDWQLTEQDIAEQFERLKNTKIIMHNGKFDYQVIKCTCGVTLPIYWDTMIAARMLDENEPSAGLKQQYIDKINPDQEKYSIDHLFENVEYAQVDPDIFALYAATDALMTYQLYMWQKEAFEDPDLQGVYKVFMGTEMPLIIVVAEMELRGIKLDKEYTLRLHDKYTKLIEECKIKITNELNLYKTQIDNWRLTPEANKKPPKKSGDGLGKSKNEQLEDPINVDSPTQLAIFLYDIMKCPQVSQKQPRGTGVDELTSLAEKTKLNICNLILEKRGLLKLMNTFIDKLPNDVKIDGKIHGSFNQLGTDTGRFSSSNPNYQQLPRDIKTIRCMLGADEGKILVGSDFSAQEVRMGAFASQDKNMIEAYSSGQDLYALIASAAFGKPYNECLEFYPEGTKIIFEGQEVICGNKTHTNLEGKKRRQNAKPICIGSLYQRGIPSIAEQIGKTKEETQEMMNKFYAGFPRLKQWMDEQKEFVKKNGYVDNWAGRRRRLPDAMLPRYEIKPLVNSTTCFNPILGCKATLNPTIINKYLTKLNGIRSRREYEDIKAEALNEGVEIHDNNGKIAQAERQSVNYPCQSGGADLTKRALINIYNSKEFNDLGFELLLTIHDEIIGQCPVENAEKIAELLPKIMVDTAMQCGINVPMKCDATVEKRWYESEVISMLSDHYNKFLSKMPEVEAFKSLCEENSELTEDQIKGVIYDHKDYLFS